MMQFLVMFCLFQNDSGFFLQFVYLIRENLEFGRQAHTEDFVGMLDFPSYVDQAYGRTG